MDVLILLQRNKIWLIDKIIKGQSLKKLKNNFCDILASGKIVWGPKRHQKAGPGLMYFLFIEMYIMLFLHNSVCDNCVLLQECKLSIPVQLVILFQYYVMFCCEA